MTRETDEILHAAITVLVVDSDARRLGWMCKVVEDARMLARRATNTSAARLAATERPARALVHEAFDGRGGALGIAKILGGRTFLVTSSVRELRGLERLAFRGVVPIDVTPERLADILGYTST